MRATPRWNRSDWNWNKSKPVAYVRRERIGGPSCERHKTAKSRQASHLRPGADQVVIDAGQPDRLRIIAPKPLCQRLNRGIEIVDQAAGIDVADHALQPEERRDPSSARDRR